MNRSIHIEYLSTLPDALHQTPAEFEREARLAMAVKLFEMKRLTSGQAALLAGIQGGVAIMLATGDLSYLEAALDTAIQSLRTAS